MNSQKRHARYRQSVYRQRKIKTVLITIICVLVALTIAFLAVGSILSGRTDGTTNEPNDPPSTSGGIKKSDISVNSRFVPLAEDGSTLGSRLSADTYDIHFEKAREDVDGAYPAINQQFAFHLREKHPELRFLDREEDMGLEGLRKSKLSYYPVRLNEKYWARLWEDDDELSASIT